MSYRDNRIAIVLSDTLRYLGLQNLLTSYFAPVEISYYPDFFALHENGSDLYDYYITDAEQFLMNADFFLPRKNKTIVLAEGTVPAAAASFSHFLTLSATQETIIGQLQGFFVSESAPVPGEANKELSVREIEVLQLIVKGAINKEIADKLSISLNTVLSHRKNITAKLGIKTVSGLTFYAMMNGYISADDIEL
ncbi:MAG: LuxR C-terminal-related transcriptional regulator [Parabacteroides sp.]|nr:LuxR C-terminal-related transcriptional regulator [Parabacteroides sp.]